MTNKLGYRTLANAVSYGAAAVLLSLASPAAAQHEHHNFNIPAQDASSALQLFARQSGKQLLFPYDAVAGRRTPAIEGDLADREVLDRLAAAAGLVVASVDGQTVTLRAAPNGRAEGAVDEQLSEAPIVVTARSLSAMRVPTPLKDIPQSVSVISRDTMDQQNVRNLSDALNYATGITVLQDNSLSSTFYSRGFQIAEIHVDGGAPLTLDGNSATVTTDMSEYDQVEVLRGADGLFGGFGNPGGTVSLQRKTPLARSKVHFEASAGSWNNYRFEGDGSTPITSNGDLRFRFVGLYEDKDYFYDTAHLERAKGYGVLEYDVDPSTVLRAGGSYEKINQVPVYFAAPHYSDGSDAHLPRSTALIPPWNRSNIESVEMFGQLERRFGMDWVLKANATRLRQTNDSKYANVIGSINPVTKLIGLPFVSSSDSESKSLLIDATLTGAFYLFGQRHEIILGADHSHLTSTIPIDSYFPMFGQFDPFTSNLDDFPEPQAQDIYLSVNAAFRRDQYGLMGALRLHPTKKLTLIGGLRDSFLNEHTNTRVKSDLFGFEFETEDSIKTNGKIVPYGGLVYKLSPNYSIYGSYADIYNPSLPLRRSDGSRLPSSIDGVNLEAGIKGAWRGGTLNGSLAFYKINQTGLHVSDPSDPDPSDPSCCYLPQTAHSKGIELELSGKMAPGWWLTAGYTYNKNKTVVDGAPEGVILSSQTPKHLFKLWTSYQPAGVLKGLSVGGGLTAQSASYVAGVGCPRFDPTGHCAPGEDPATPFRLTQKTYAVVDLRAAYAFSEHWSLALSVNNLFDKRYYQNIGQGDGGLSDAWYGTPRNFLLKLTSTY